MEAICSSETSVKFQQTTRRDIPEDSTVHMNDSLREDHCTTYAINLSHRTYAASLTPVSKMRLKIHE
jgi:hypothetical protein